MIFHPASWNDHQCNGCHHHHLSEPSPTHHWLHRGRTGSLHRTRKQLLLNSGWRKKMFMEIFSTAARNRILMQICPTIQRLKYLCWNCITIELQLEIRAKNIARNFVKPGQKQNHGRKRWTFWMKHHDQTVRVENRAENIGWKLWLEFGAGKWNY